MPLRRCQTLSVLRGRTSRLRRRAADVSLGVPTNIGNVERPNCQECFIAHSIRVTGALVRTRTARTLRGQAVITERCSPRSCHKSSFFFSLPFSITVSGMPRRLRYVPVLQSYHNRYTALPGTGYLNRLHQTKCGVFHGGQRNILSPTEY